MLLQVEESVIANAVAAMMKSNGKLDPETAAMMAYAERVRAADCTPLYLLDSEEQSIGVYILETYGKTLH